MRKITAVTVVFLFLVAAIGCDSSGSRHLSTNEQAVSTRSTYATAAARSAHRFNKHSSDNRWGWDEANDP